MEYYSSMTFLDKKYKEIKTEKWERRQRNSYFCFHTQVESAYHVILYHKETP